METLFIIGRRNYICLSLILSCIFSFSPVVFAQTNVGAASSKQALLSIKGVPVEGDVIQFVNALERNGIRFSTRGFEETDTYAGFNQEKSLQQRISDRDAIPLYGVILDHYVFFSVYYTRTSHQVFRVDIMFDKPAGKQFDFQRFGDGLNSVVLDYLGIKNQLVIKYDKPFVTEEIKIDKTSTASNIKAMISSGKPVLRCGFLAPPTGTVILSLDYLNLYSGTFFVNLSYLNIENEKLNKEEVLKIYHNDI